MKEFVKPPSVDPGLVVAVSSTPPDASGREKVSLLLADGSRVDFVLSPRPGDGPACASRRAVESFVLFGPPPWPIVRRLESAEGPVRVSVREDGSLAIFSPGHSPFGLSVGEIREVAATLKEVADEFEFKKSSPS